MKVYGSCVHTMTQLKDLASVAFGLRFEPHESSFRCGAYWLAEHDWIEQVIIQENCVEGDGEPFEPQFPHHGVLLYVATDVDPTPAEQIDGLELLDTR
jgi:hypothetical protein